MQIASMSKGMKLQEHQILYMFAIKLKELCNKLGVHIDSSTQLNGEYKNARDKDETLLRGTESACNSLSVYQRGIFNNANGEVLSCKDEDNPVSWLLGSSDVSTNPAMGVGKLLIRFSKQGSYGNVSKR